MKLLRAANGKTSVTLRALKTFGVVRLGLMGTFNDIPNIRKKGCPDLMAQCMQEKVQVVLDSVALGANTYSEHVLVSEETDKLKVQYVQVACVAIDNELNHIVKDEQTFDKAHGPDIKKLVWNCEP